MWDFQNFQMLKATGAIFDKDSMFKYFFWFWICIDARIILYCISFDYTFFLYILWPLGYFIHRLGNYFLMFTSKSFYNCIMSHPQETSWQCKKLLELVLQIKIIQIVGASVVRLDMRDNLFEAKLSSCINKWMKIYNLCSSLGASSCS